MLPKYKLFLIESVKPTCIHVGGLEGEVQSNNHASVKELFSRVFCMGESE